MRIGCHQEGRRGSVLKRNMRRMTVTTTSKSASAWRNRSAYRNIHDWLDGRWWRECLSDGDIDILSHQVGDECPLDGRAKDETILSASAERENGGGTHLED